MEQKKTDSDKDGNKDGGRGRDDVAKTDDSGMDLDIPENTDTNRNKDKSNNSNKSVNRTPGRHDRTANRGTTSRYVQRRVDPLHSFVISSLFFVTHFSCFSLCFPFPLFILHSLFLCHHSFFFFFYPMFVRSCCSEPSFAFHAPPFHATIILADSIGTLRSFIPFHLDICTNSETQALREGEELFSCYFPFIIDINSRSDKQSLEEQKKKAKRIVENWAAYLLNHFSCCQRRKRNYEQPTYNGILLRESESKICAVHFRILLKCHVV